MSLGTDQPRKGEREVLTRMEPVLNAKWQAFEKNPAGEGDKATPGIEARKRRRREVEKARRMQNDVGHAKGARNNSRTVTQHTARMRRRSRWSPRMMAQTRLRSRSRQRRIEETDMNPRKRNRAASEKKKCNELEAPPAHHPH